MRGKGHICRRVELGTGITPAYAGKSGKNQFDVVPDQDHPRLCGEKKGSRAGNRSHKGSPPPMRGKDPHYAKNTSWNRITPAYAGKSAAVPNFSGRQKDHPRLCGEKSSPFRAFASVEGSPPPMRGKGFFRENFPARSRITPAYAGKRARTQSTPRRIRDHPRLCGEKTGLSSILRTE